MSAAGYKRATKKHRARIDYLYGDSTEGFLMVPIGMDFVGKLMQAENFLHFELDGEETYVNLAAVKRVTSIGGEDEEASTTSNSAKAERDERADRESDAEPKAKPKPKKRESRYSSTEEFDALDVLGLGEYADREEIQIAYRRLVKLYHPDRLRGLGVEDAKIRYAEQRLADINNAYRILNKVAA